MSDFMDMFVDLLPVHSKLRREDNPLRVVLERSLGEYMDSVDTGTVFDGLFLSSAEGGWLDAHGRDFGVVRRVDEDDESYRRRIVFEKLEFLTSRNLIDVYGLVLYVFVAGFNARSNCLTSDNPYFGNQFMCVASDELQSILHRKFVLGNELLFLNSDLRTDSIRSVDDRELIAEYSDLFGLSDASYYFRGNVSLGSVFLSTLKATNCSEMFGGCSGLTSVDLSLPVATDCSGMFVECSGLTSVDLSLPVATNCNVMLWGCSGLTSVDLSLPVATDCSEMFGGCSGLTSVDLTLPLAIDCSGMFGYCSGLTSVDLTLPVATNCNAMLWGCVSLTDVTLNLPQLNNYRDIFKDCSNLESININLPTSLVNNFKSYVQGLNLSNLTSLIINGEEVNV